MPTAHDSWADVYDLAYEETLGYFLDQLTESTIEVVKRWQSTPAKIVDFGAGTGRLAIPLANSGYTVTAVDPSSKMLEALKRKDGALHVKTVNSEMQNFVANDPYDMALCVFTVIAYFAEREDLIRALSSAYESLKPGGFLLIDVPRRSLFQSQSPYHGELNRTVQINPIDEFCYDYSEEIELLGDGKQKYSDRFIIRYWPKDDIVNVLKNLGFTELTRFENLLSDVMPDYLLFQKHL